MSPFAESGLASAQHRLEAALAHIEDFTDGSGDPRDISRAYAEMRRLRGILLSLVQLDQLETEYSACDTERPRPVQKLAVVRP